MGQKNLAVLTGDRTNEVCLFVFFQENVWPFCQTANFFWP